jgi:two-component system sensor histidine kinase RegB
VVAVSFFAKKLCNPVEINCPENPELSSATFAREPILQSLTALLKNASDASPRNLPIHLSVGLRDRLLQFCIEDHGEGMTDEMLRRIGEPFFTTKEPGQGMGLGAFLASTIAEQLGGRLFYESALHKGTLAVFEIPISPDAEDQIDG